MINTENKSRSNQANQNPVKGGFFYHLGFWIGSHPWKIVSLWAFLLIVGGIGFPQLNKSLTVSGFTANNSESQRVATLLKTGFSQQFAEQDLLVFQSDSLTIHEPAFQVVINKTISQVETQNGVVAVFSPLQAEQQNQVSSDGHAAFALIGVTGGDDQRLELAKKLTDIATTNSIKEVQSYVTGFSALTSDLADQGTGDLSQIELFGLPLALVVLLLAFGTGVAALLPIPLALVGVMLAFGILGYSSIFVSHYNLVIENMVPMIGLGVGIDYSLFIITRFREELLLVSSVREAVALTMASAGKTIFFSGSTVMIALSGLLLIDSKVFIDLAVGTILAVAVMVLCALTLLPAILALLGVKINRWKIPFIKNSVNAAEVEHGLWAGWARIVMKHPVIWIMLVVISLLAATLPVFGLKLGTDLGTASLTDRPSGKALTILGRYFSQGELSPLEVLVETKNGPFTTADLNQLATLTTTLKSDKDVSDVLSLTSILDQYVGNHTSEVLNQLITQPQAANLVGYYLNLKRGSNLTSITVVPKVPIDSPAAETLVKRIRTEYAAQLTGLNIMVGGTSAENADLGTEVMTKLPWVLALVLGLSFLVLTVAFHSLFLPFKAILMNLFSIGASFGLLVLVFQNGLGEKIFNFHSPGTIQIYLPILAFAILFGLSMDYEVFLIGRMKEEWRNTGDNNLAVERGLEHIARVITSAAAIMVTIFAAFTFSSVLEIKQMGFALAVAVLVDATLIRILLVPAAMKVMGKWNWWLPRPLYNILPRVDL